MYKNVVTPIIVMLGLLRLNMGISDASMKTMESNDCKELLKDDRDTNRMLAMI